MLDNLLEVEVDMAKKTADKINTLADSIADSIKDAIKTIAGSMDTLGSSFSTNMVGILSSVKKFSDFRKAIEDISGSFTLSNDVVKENAKNIADVANATDNSTKSKLKELPVNVGNTIAAKLGTSAIEEENVAKEKSIGLTIKDTIATGAKTVATGIATVATKLFNAALNACGGALGLIVAVAVAVVSGIIALVNIFNKGSEAVEASKKEMEGFREANEELKGSMEESTEAYRDNQNAIEGSSRVTEGLLDELIALDAEMKSGKGDVDALRAKVAQLNDAEEGLNLTFDETTRSLSMTTDEIKSYIDAAKKMSSEDAIINRMSELTDELSAVESEIYALEKVQAGYQRMKEEGIVTESEYKEMLAGTKVELEHLENTQKAVTNEIMALNDDYIDSVASKSEAEQAALAEQKAAAEEQKAAIREMADQYHMSYDEMAKDFEASGKTAEEYKAANIEAFEENKAAVEGYAETWGMSVEEIMAACEEQNISVHECNSNMEDAWESYRNLVSEKVSNIVNGFKSMSENYSMSGKEMLDNLKHNKEQYAEWEANMEEITKKLGPTAAAEFEKLGPEANSALKDILGSTDLLEQYRDEFGVVLDETTGNAIESFNNPDFINAGSDGFNKMSEAVKQSGSMEEAGEHEGTKLVEGFNNAVSAGETTGLADSYLDAISNDVTEKSDEIAETVENTAESVKQAVESHITLIKALILDGIDKLAVDMAEGMVNVEKAISESTTRIKDSFNLYDSIKFAGEDTMTGFKRGLLSGALAVYTTARSIANNVSSTIKSALQIHSPSRVMEKLGGFTMEGFANGMESMKTKISDITQDISDRVRGGFSRALCSADVSGSLEFSENSLNPNYVITVPVSIDGREVARVTAPYTEAELQHREIRRSRMAGVRR